MAGERPDAEQRPWSQVSDARGAEEPDPGRGPRLPGTGGLVLGGDRQEGAQLVQLTPREIREVPLPLSDCGTLTLLFVPLSLVAW